MGKHRDLHITGICDAVQHNCAISDARYARDYSMCIYLLRMREFYRWKHDIPLGVTIDAAALGNWVVETETYWDTIEETEFHPIVINGSSFDPFDANLINAELNQLNLVYSAGLGRLGQPHFILAEHRHRSKNLPANYIETGCELARDLITLPAMTQNGTIYIRHESIVRMFWQMVEEWSINKQAGPMARLIDHYAIEVNGRNLKRQLETTANDLSDLLLHHELGELQAGELLGSQYNEMTSTFHHKRGEGHIRAVRDLLADTLETWPFIVREKYSHHLDFWLAGLNGIREELLKQTGVYECLHNGGSDTRLNTLATLIEPQRTRWQQVAEQLLDDYKSHKETLDIEQAILNALSKTP